jgi:glucose-1-phosphate adenylyltransferase
MKRPRILALVLAGGAGSRLKQLTARRAKPALPFGGVFRLIDFPLSNCMHSQINDVWVVEQFQPHALNEHLTNGRPWDLDRTHGGLQILPPYQGAPESGWHQGNADAIYRHRRFIREFDPEVLLVLSADHIYKLDYRDVIDAHLQTKAEVTLVTTEVSPEEASRFGNLDADGSGKVTRFDYKPEQAKSQTATTEVFAYDAKVLLTVLDELAAQKAKEKPEAEEIALEDFGHELLPALVQRDGAFAYQLDGYWRDVGTVDSYHQGHMDLLCAQPSLQLDDAAWPIRTRGQQLLPARIEGSAHIENSLIAPGCHIAGRVVNSILSPRVRVEAGAIVENCVLLHHAVVPVKRTLRYAVVDENIRVEQNTEDKEITIIGHEEP